MAGIVNVGSLFSGIGGLDEGLRRAGTQDPISGEQAPAMGKGNKQGCATIGVSAGVGVRRLTPTECERLQGFPDGWTQLGDTADSRRYSALGDAVTVNVAEWIGRRLP